MSARPTQGASEKRAGRLGEDYLPHPHPEEPPASRASSTWVRPPQDKEILHSLVRAERAGAVREARDHDLDLQKRRRPNDTFGFTRLLKDGLPVFELLEGLIDHDVCVVPEDLLLQIGAKSAHHAQHRNQHA